MKLFKTLSANLLLKDESYYLIDEPWDDLINKESLFYFLTSNIQNFIFLEKDVAIYKLQHESLPPIGQQEVWAAGVTYYRSMEARMEESKSSGGADLYDRVYHAERPELFFKAMAHRVAGDGQMVYIRRDSQWNVPEPELTLYLNSSGKIQAYTIGNDMSSRSIEGENALYLPQAKIYERSTALGPCLYIPEKPIHGDVRIEIKILRANECLFSDSVSIDKIKRSFDELAGYLFRECEFPYGCFLMTGTSLVPPNDFTLMENDIVEITIDNIGTLTNSVGYNN